MFRCHHRIFLFPYLTLTYPVSAFKQRICFICSPKFCRTDKLAYQISCVTTDWKTDMETWFFQFIFINVIQDRITAPCPVLILRLLLRIYTWSWLLLYSHSTVEGGFEVISNTIREIPFTSDVILLLALSRTS